MRLAALLAWNSTRNNPHPGHRTGWGKRKGDGEMEFMIARSKQGCGCIRFAMVTKDPRGTASKAQEIEWAGEVAKEHKRLIRQGYKPEFVSEAPNMGGCEVCDSNVRKKKQTDLFAKANP